MGLILVISEDAIEIETIKTELSVHGWWVTVAGDRRAALQVAADQAPQLVIVDSDVAESIELIQAFGAASGGPGVLVCGAEDAGRSLALREAGADELLTKPLDGARLLEAVQRCVTAPRQQPVERPAASARLLTSEEIFGDVLRELEEVEEVEEAEAEALPAEGPPAETPEPPAFEASPQRPAPHPAAASSEATTFGASPAAAASPEHPAPHPAAASSEATTFGASPTSAASPEHPVPPAAAASSEEPTSEASPASPERPVPPAATASSGSADSSTFAASAPASAASTTTPDSPSASEPSPATAAPGASGESPGTPPARPVRREREAPDYFPPAPPSPPAPARSPAAADPGHPLVSLAGLFDGEPMGNVAQDHGAPEGGRVQELDSLWEGEGGSAARARGAEWRGEERRAADRPWTSPAVPQPAATPEPPPLLAGSPPEPLRTPPSAAADLDPAPPAAGPDPAPAVDPAAGRLAAVEEVSADSEAPGEPPAAPPEPVEQPSSHFEAAGRQRVPRRALVVGSIAAALLLAIGIFFLLNPGAGESVDDTGTGAPAAAEDFVTEDLDAGVPPEVAAAPAESGEAVPPAPDKVGAAASIDDPTVEDLDLQAIVDQELERREKELRQVFLEEERRLLRELGNLDAADEQADGDGGG